MKNFGLNEIPESMAEAEQEKHQDNLARLAVASVVAHLPSFPTPSTEKQKRLQRAVFDDSSAGHRKR